MVGIQDIAATLGISASTVSRALRDLPNVSPTTRQMVEEAAEKLGYVHSMTAAGLVTGRTMAISVVVPAIAKWFYAQVLEGVASALREANYDMVLFDLGWIRGERARTFRRSLLRHRGDAVLAVCLDFSPEEREELRVTGLPTIVVGTRVRGLRRVGIDEQAAGYRATKHLIDLGHRDILHLTGGAETDRGLNRSVPQGRLRGYRDALTEAGIEFDPSRVLPGWFSITTAGERMDQFLDSGARLPTAIFAAGDEMAIGAISSLRRHGLSVPDDVSVIGIDDHELAEPFGLTTFAQNPFEQGVVGARVLLDDLAGTTSRAKSHILPVTLIDRSSTRRL
ncbi:MAG: LacI family transcriptional regulator [Propionibacteriaceae bacterium]|jgi:DNA-binding LacI/PurR family transcriptional regulator|nr:LacI family transcriptional regulator [Propionibacteriaceae bacterium]